ncbi:MAG TPA: PaaI family thioesterase [Ideonella sp.]|uniref:PaaI family thioesterase n=1 Tax=Ideonella sp. TaxID=1929293 RepID=UPI002C8EE4C7|nr:PaaI family thioesterase [Ideonella sp.]HSI49121.1 PaaI family thioesterase [Ideonella sp.]
MSNATPQAFPIPIPFAHHLGLQFYGCTEDTAEVRVWLQPPHLNGWDVAHGGLLMTMLDISMALAARSGQMEGPGVATIELKTSFLRPAEGELRAIGHVLQRTVTMAFCEGRILNSAGDLCAHATATFKFLRAMPVNPHRVNPAQRGTPSSGDA